MKQTLSIPRNSLTTLRYLIAALILLATTAAYYLTSTQPAAAATPPDSCFAFNTGTGTITNYYNHEANNPANPACPKDVDIPATIGGTSVMVIGNNAFYNKQITTVTLGSSVTTIGNSAFYNNQLTSVTIPNAVTTIGDWAFAYNQLTSVTITGNLTTIGTEILSENPVETISYNGTTYTDATANHESCFVFNAGTGTITNFRHADPAFIKSNGQACLDRNVTIPSTIGGVAVTTIGGSAFRNNQLTSVTIPNSATTIGNYAFYGNQLTSVIIPGSVTSIGEGAFILQNQYGGNIESSNGIGPNIWSSDPAEIQAAYEEIWYARLYTEDPSNPNNLPDSVVSESDWWGMDANEDGEDDSFGGHLINPAAAEVSYKNASGTELQASLTSVGQLPNGDRIQTYYADQGPRLFNTNNPTPEEVEATRQALTAYHRLGDSVTFTPPSISGYQTPSPHTLTLTEPTTEHSFVYAANTTNPPATPPTKHTGAPKLTKVTWSNAKPILRGLFDSSNTNRLQVTFAGQTFVLGESTELTASGDAWTLDLTTSSATFEAETYDIAIQATDQDGNVLSAQETTTLTQAMLDGEEGVLAETGESMLYATGAAAALLLAGSYALIRVNRTAKRGNV